MLFARRCVIQLRAGGVDLLTIITAPAAIRVVIVMPILLITACYIPAAIYYMPNFVPRPGVLNITVLLCGEHTTLRGVIYCTTVPTRHFSTFAARVCACALYGAFALRANFTPRARER